MAKRGWSWCGWISAAVVLAACGGDNDPAAESCPSMPLCTTNLAIDEEVESICETKANGTSRCWNGDGTPAGDLALPDARYKRVQLGMAGPIGLTDDGRMFGARGALPPDLPLIADYRATNLGGQAGLCLLAQDGRLLYGNYLPDANPPRSLRVEPGPFVDISCAWEGLVCAINTDGTLWGNTCLGPAAATDGWAQLSISLTLQCGLTRGGGITCYRRAFPESAVAPTFTGGPYRQVATTFHVACALDRAGNLSCARADGEALAVDRGPFTFIATGRDLVCGIRPDGTWTCFRQNGIGTLIGEDPSITALLPIARPSGTYE